jgi:hypothetical protein
MTSHLTHYFQIKVSFLWRRFTWFAAYSGSSTHLLIDLKSPEYLDLPQHSCVLAAHCHTSSAGQPVHVGISCPRRMEWQKVRSETLYNLYAWCYDNKTRWVRYVASIRRWEMHTKFRSENLKEINNLEDLGVHERIIKWILGKWNIGVWTELRTGNGAQDREYWRALVNRVMQLRVP